MKAEHRDLVLSSSGATSLIPGPQIQRLWGGYGQIVRVLLEGCGRPSVVLKHVQFPPRASPSDPSHARKVRSYQVEALWYRDYATGPRCRTPLCLASCCHGDERLMVLEDLDAAGFDHRRSSVGSTELRACLRWLAHFHALFLGRAPDGLWPVGTYWHLDTRPDELEAMDHPELKAAAGTIDKTLRDARFQTIVHGDAKLANFCFSATGSEVAAVDFQYVGGGCGMKDVAYFLGSCLDERECEKKVPSLLDFYFSELETAVDRDVDFVALEAEWRDMFAFAWTDFYRFLLGWAPGHWKINCYSKKLAKEVLHKLRDEK